MAKGKSKIEQKDGMGFAIVAIVMSAISAICLNVLYFETMTQADTSINPITAMISVISESINFDNILQSVAVASVALSAVCLSFAIQRGKRNDTQTTLTFLATAYDVIFLLALITSQIAQFIPLP